MKVGEQLAVSIAGMEVGAGIIEDLTDGVVTIVIPATRVRMGVRQSLEPLAPSGTEVSLTEDRTLLQPNGDPTVQSNPQDDPSAFADGRLSAEQVASAPTPINETTEPQKAPTAVPEPGVSLRSMELDSSALD